MPRSPLPQRKDGYLPIADYGAIGNLRTTLLVGRDGCIDWAPFPDLASQSVFSSILDSSRGGRFRVAPVEPRSSRQRYLEGTCVLETRFEAEGGAVRITDFMPLAGSMIGCNPPESSPEVHRLIHCESGEVEMELDWTPRFEYARERTEIERRGDAFLARGGDHGQWLVPGRLDCELSEWSDGQGAVRGRFRMRSGDRVALTSGYVEAARADRPPVADLDTIGERLERTCRVWRDRVDSGDLHTVSDWAGEWTDLVVRSALTLKLLTRPETGAIAAAATTSLPEEIGGVRNWDYRYCWIRDAIFTTQALYAVGHREEALKFLHFAERSAAEKGQKDDYKLQIMYGLGGETDLPEEELDHFQGYRSSRPVRVGNAAVDQQQHDIYGELLEAAHEIVIHGDDLPEEQWEFLSRTVDHACSVWHTPDAGLWEIRNVPRHFVYSKLMIWATMDRAISLAEKGKLKGDATRWHETRERVKDVILRRGYDSEVESFVQAFGWTSLDASNLLIPLHGLLPPDDRRVQNTIDRTMERLTENGLVYRYDPEETQDGIEGGEGAFGLCTFWLVDALALSRRSDEAREIFEGMVSRVSPLGLYAEQIDATSGELLGNFPQAFTHLGLINSALYLARAEGRQTPELPWPELEALKTPGSSEGSG